MEHLHRIKGVFIQSLADQGQFLKEVMSDGDDVAADLVVAPIGAIQQLARTGPDQFLSFIRPIVNNDTFKIIVGLCRQTIQALNQMRGTVT